MTVKAELPDGTVLEFPDGTTQDVIQATVKRTLGVDGPQPPQEAETQPSAPQTPAAMTAETLDLDPEIKERPLISPIRAVDNATKLEFVTPQIALDIVRAALLPGQAQKGAQTSVEDLLNAALTFGPSAIRGAGVANVVSREAVQDLPQAAKTFETQGRPSTFTPSGTFTGKEATEEAAARAARFEEQGIPATRGDVTQTFAQQAAEQKLLSSAVDATAAEPLRQLKLQQSQAFEANVSQLVDDLGVPARTGDTIKDALSGRKALLRQEKNQLYKEVAETAPEIASAPIIIDDIAKALPSAETLEDIAIVGANVEGIQKALIRFGIEKDPAAVAAFTESGGTITPLTLGNFERFRKILGGLERADQTGSAGVAIGPIRRALDEEAAFIDDAIREAGITDASIITTLKEARGRVRTLKTEFSPQATVGKLIDVKRDGVTPVVEASKVAQELLRPNAAKENLERVMASLRSSGAKGKKAIGDLQASVVMEALESALKAPSRKTSGIETIGGNQFSKALDKFGQDKLDILFKDKEKALNSLLNLKQTALDITPTAGAVPRGSASVILDLVNKAGTIPGLAVFRDVLTFVVRAGADDRAVAKALKSTPLGKKRIKVLKGIRRDFPTIAERLGILTILNEVDEQTEEREFIAAGGA